MRILVWNLNHRARSIPVGGWIAGAIGAMAPDAVVLTEYVPGTTHATFVADLAREGLTEHLTSDRVLGQNQVMILSRAPLQRGEIRGRADIPSLPSNVLHVRVPELDVDVLGLRIPFFTRKEGMQHWKGTWNWIHEAAHDLRGRPAIIAGDFNTDPASPPIGCRDCLTPLITAGWQHALPTEGGSFRSRTGRWSRIDYAFVTAQFQIGEVRYVTECAGITITHFGHPTLPDHAAMTLDLEHRIA